MANVLIIIPRIDGSGPVRGAIALANILVKYNKVYVYHHKNCSIESKIFIHKNINIISFESKNFFSKIFFLNKFISKHKITHSISYCFSSDILNTFLKSHSYRIIYIRGNLLKNYYFDYYFLGYFLFILHLSLLFFIDKIFVLNDSSFSFYNRLFRDKVYLLNNFIDENSYKIRDKVNQNKFLYVGSFSSRKNILSLLNSFESFIKKYQNATLTLVGQGPLRSDIDKFIVSRKLKNKIILLNYTSDIYKLYSDYDYYVSFSFSEGTSRAVLEALYCGLPCLIADVDSNHQIIKKNINGILFKFNDNNDKEFEELIKIKPKNYSILNSEYRVKSISKKLNAFFSPK